jgi:hypothetical protein
MLSPACAAAIFLADAKLAWRDAYATQQRTALRPLAQAAE